MARNIVPRTNKGADLGTPAKNWNTVYADSVIANNVQGENLKAVEQSAGDEITLRSLIASAGSSPMSIAVYDDIPITDDLIVPENIELNVKLGGKLSVSATKTLTINGSFSAGLYQVFSGDGSVLFGTSPNSRINPMWFGAIGDGVADDTIALQRAIDAISADTGLAGRTLYFPSGVYKTTSTLTVDASGVVLCGDNEGGTSSFSPLSTSGPHILYYGNDGGPILRIGRNTAYRYSNKIQGLRIGASSSVSVKPIGLQLNACSEFTLSDFHINGNCSVGLSLNACFIGTVQNFDVSANDVGIDMYVSDPLGIVTSCSSIWFSNANIWDSKQDAVRIRNNATNIVFRDSWIEYTNNVFNIIQQSNISTTVILKLYNVQASVSGGGYSNSRFVRCRAFDTGNEQLNVSILAIGCQTFNYDATHNIVYTKGTNSSANSYMNQAVFDSCTFYGASEAVATSDTGSSSFFFTGKTRAQDGFSSGVNIPLVSGDAKLHKLTTAFGFWDMQGGYPIRLPTIDARSFAEEGQFYYQPSKRRLAFTENGFRTLLPRPRMGSLGDESITFDVVSGPETLRCSTTLTANRSITLSTVNAYNGARLRVFRQVGTGDYVIDVGPGLKSLTAGQWCDVEFSGTYWYLTAFGEL